MDTCKKHRIDFLVTATASDYEEYQQELQSQRAKQKASRLTPSLITHGSIYPQQYISDNNNNNSSLQNSYFIPEATVLPSFPNLACLVPSDTYYTSAGTRMAVLPPKSLSLSSLNHTQYQLPGNSNVRSPCVFAATLASLPTPPSSQEVVPSLLNEQAAQQPTVTTASASAVRSPPSSPLLPPPCSPTTGSYEPSSSSSSDSTISSHKDRSPSFSVDTILEASSISLLLPQGSSQQTSTASHHGPSDAPTIDHRKSRRAQLLPYVPKPSRDLDEKMRLSATAGSTEEFVSLWISALREKTYCRILSQVNLEQDRRIQCTFSADCTKKTKGVGNLRRHVEWHLRTVEEEIRNHHARFVSMTERNQRRQRSDTQQQQQQQTSNTLDSDVKMLFQREMMNILNKLCSGNSDIPSLPFQ